LIDINISVGDDKIVYFQDAWSAKGALERLAGVYANEGIANKLDLEMKLSAKKLKPSESTKKYIEKMKRITDKLGTLRLNKEK
jgi:hypothetical protein